MGRIKEYLQLASNMGLRYILFRSGFEIKRRAGLLKRTFPANPPEKDFLSLDDWRSGSRPFFFRERSAVNVPQRPTGILNDAANNILAGKIQFFSNQYFDLGNDYDWITNPDSGFRYDISKHWTEVNDYSKEAGDIKYVWEKSRFSYLYTIIRYDHHSGEDHSRFVFDEIESWMRANPVNMGPNYKCSQEISLRILNWIFALYFYKQSPFLTDGLFSKIVNCIYWQLHHVYRNINFSRIAVRNNHAVTETLALYVVSSLFPQFPESEKWKREGKKWFEEEIAYQIYEDGTHLQFSMNYHRVVVQLLTWGIRIAELNDDRFKDIVYERALKSVNFLYQCQEESNGFLPDYGSNDGALFFRLCDNDYRDYRPQLDALHYLLTGTGLYPGREFEDAGWFGKSAKPEASSLKKLSGIIRFPQGGFYLIREQDTLTFIRCGKHKDRPAHADNLHLDIWYKGENILMDAGTYKYNTDDRRLKYYMGTESHNTVMLGDYDQMLKGARFIWYNWSQALSASVNESDTEYEFRGKVSCFTYLSKDIIHERIISKKKDRPEWTVVDVVYNKPAGCVMKQLWHTGSLEKVSFETEPDAEVRDASYSPYYGIEMPDKQITVRQQNNIISTKIELIQ